MNGWESLNDHLRFIETSHFYSKYIFVQNKELGRKMYTSILMLSERSIQDLKFENTKIEKKKKHKHISLHWM